MIIPAVLHLPAVLPDYKLKEYKFTIHFICCVDLFMVYSVVRLLSSVSQEKYKEMMRIQPNRTFAQVFTMRLNGNSQSTPSPYKTNTPVLLKNIKEILNNRSRERQIHTKYIGKAVGHIVCCCDQE